MLPKPFYLKGTTSSRVRRPHRARAGYFGAGAILLNVIVLQSALTVTVALTVLPAFFSSPAKL